MARDRTPIETEIKLSVASAAQARKLLLGAGYRILHRRVFEANTVFDTPALDYRQRAELIRLRQVASRSILTYKGRPRPGRHKSREEIEVSVSEAAPIVTILGRLGLQPVFRYEKFRAEYYQPGQPGHATLDETPIGVFVELEGPPDWIDRSARDLGFSAADYITLSYGRLYQLHRERHPNEPADMVFHAKAAPAARP